MAMALPRRSGGWAALLLALLAAALLALPAMAAPSFPKLTGRVVDAANILPPDVSAGLEQKLAALEQSTGGTQLVVATVPDLQGYEIEEYGYQLGRAWGIGRAKANNGVILLVAPNERKVRIEVGYGMEGQLTDALSSQIIQTEILPRFRAGDMPGGIAAGTDALIQQLQAPPDVAQANLAKAAAAQQRAHREHHGSASAGSLFWLAIVLLWLFFSVFRGRRGSSIGNAIIWGSMMNGGWGRGGGGGWGGGGGGFGGGGFGGGGGSFGGGGASGGW
jgi:uncharacterized protein